MYNQDIFNKAITDTLCDHNMDNFKKVIESKLNDEELSKEEKKSLLNKCRFTAHSLKTGKNKDLIEVGSKFLTYIDELLTNLQK